MIFNPEQVRQFYNEYGEKEWTRLDSSAYGRLLYHGHSKFMEPYIGPEKKVLDAGCGAGRFSIPIAQSGSRVTLLDISDDQLALAKQKLEEKGLTSQVDNFIRADISNLDLIQDNYFDTVICYGAVLNYLFTNVKKAVSELKRVTKDGGMLLFSVNSLFGVLRLCAVNEGMIPQKFWGQPEYWKIHEVATTGNLYHPDVNHPPRHFYTAAEMKKILTEVGLNQVEVAASPSILSGLRTQAELLEQNSIAWKAILEVEDISCCVENLADVGEFLLIKGKVVKCKNDVIETSRLILREFCSDDWKCVHQYAIDSKVTKFMPWGPNTEEETKAFIDKVLIARDKAPRQEHHFAIIEKSSGKFIGAIEICENGMLGYCYSRDA